jgi:low temperature requirement protein LtrA
MGGLIMLSSLLVAPPGRYWVWAVAVLVLMGTPVVAVRAYEGQPFDSRHIPERYGLFTIIVLGESVIAVAASLGDVALDGGAIASALLGFAIAAAIWWGYFETVSSTSLSRERVGASFLWGYGHLLGFAGIAATAIGVELAVEAGAAGDHGLSLAARLMLGGGVAAFLVSLVAVHSAEIGWRGAGMMQRWIAIAALLVVAGVSRGWPPALVVGAVFAVLATSVALDVAQHGGKGLAAHTAPGDDQIPPTP